MRSLDDDSDSKCSRLVNAGDESECAPVSLSRIFDVTNKLGLSWIFDDKQETQEFTRYTECSTRVIYDQENQDRSPKRKEQRKRGFGHYWESEEQERIIFNKDRSDASCTVNDSDNGNDDATHVVTSCSVNDSDHGNDAEAHVVASCSVNDSDHGNDAETHVVTSCTVINDSDHRNKNDNVDTHHVEASSTVNDSEHNNAEIFSPSAEDKATDIPVDDGTPRTRGSGTTPAKDPSLPVAAIDFNEDRSPATSGRVSSLGGSINMNKNNTAREHHDDAKEDEYPDVMNLSGDHLDLLSGSEDEQEQAGPWIETEDPFAPNDEGASEEEDDELVGWNVPGKSVIVFEDLMEGDTEIQGTSVQTNPTGDDVLETIELEKATVGQLKAFCREFGFGLELTQEQLDEVNHRRSYPPHHKYIDPTAAMEVYSNSIKQPLTKSPFVFYFEYGNNLEGYWNYDRMVLQLEDCVDCLMTLFPHFDFIFTFDHISGHAKKRVGGLDAPSMNKSF